MHGYGFSAVHLTLPLWAALGRHELVEQAPTNPSKTFCHRRCCPSAVSSIGYYVWSKDSFSVSARSQGHLRRLPYHYVGHVPVPVLNSSWEW